ncbi:hypothetical protein AAEU32_07110 [Pseudoalteromonas sp. SSDWG2]|uniref:hypothetical protein n=1 Tax=Pseudoalteromonas sp. SSDWG2 TaxID=3139391 RepID=UPI003BABFA0A
MNKLNTLCVAVFVGLLAVIVGLCAFTLSWNLWAHWGGPMPGVHVILWPANMSLVYVWHPLFTEEINFWPKLMLMMLGQFIFVSGVAAALLSLVKRVMIEPQNDH